MLMQQKIPFGSFHPSNVAGILHGPRVLLLDIYNQYLGVDPKIGGKPPKSSILIGVFHEINHPFWGAIINFGNTHLYIFTTKNTGRPSFQDNAPRPMANWSHGPRFPCLFFVGSGDSLSSCHSCCLLHLRRQSQLPGNSF